MGMGYNGGFGSPGVTSAVNQMQLGGGPGGFRAAAGLPPAPMNGQANQKQPSTSAGAPPAIQGANSIMAQLMPFFQKMHQNEIQQYQLTGQTLKDLSQPGQGLAAQFDKVKEGIGGTSPWTPGAGGAAMTQAMQQGRPYQGFNGQANQKFGGRPSGYMQSVMRGAPTGLTTNV